MIIDFDNYEKLILEAYQQKVVDGSLPSAFINPTPAGLKKECIRACRDRFLKKDEKAIRDFFVEGSESKTCLQIIEQCDIDKFKPILNYLKSGGIIKTKEKNILLLAWLIDYHDRPFEFDRRYGPNAITESESRINKPVGDELVTEQQSSKLIAKGDIFGIGKPVQTTETDRKEEEQATSVPENTASVLKVLPAWRYWNALVGGLLLLLAGIIGFGTWDKGSYTMGAAPNGGCMYWAGDHYQPVPCNQKVPNTLVVALDTLLVKNFRKITQPDTITNRAKGWVWYSKINNKLEFFTCAGEHPVVIGRRLKPITDYMIDKYIKPGIVSGQLQDQPTDR